MSALNPADLIVVDDHHGNGEMGAFLAQIVDVGSTPADQYPPNPILQGCSGYRLEPAGGDGMHDDGFRPLLLWSSNPVEKLLAMERRAGVGEEDLQIE